MVNILQKNKSIISKQVFNKCFLFNLKVGLPPNCIIEWQAKKLEVVSDGYNISFNLFLIQLNFSLTMEFSWHILENKKAKTDYKKASSKIQEQLLCIAKMKAYANKTISGYL